MNENISEDMGQNVSIKTMGKISRKERRERLMQEMDLMMKKNSGITKASELYTLGMDYRKIQSFVDAGYLKRVKNGYYSLCVEEPSEESVVAGLFPDGILTLESALFYYGYIKKKPLQWQIAVDKNTSKSRFKMDYPLVQPFYTEPEVLKMGVTEIPFAEGVMKIYNKERLLCDCMKFEEKLDHEIMKQAMIHYLADEEKNIGRLMEYAKIRKVARKVEDRIGVWL